jgi:hypothetical protein
LGIDQLDVVVRWVFAPGGSPLKDMGLDIIQWSTADNRGTTRRLHLNTPAIPISIFLLLLGFKPFATTDPMASLTFL